MSRLDASSDRPTALLSGAGGFLGGFIHAALQAAGLLVKTAGRLPGDAYRVELADEADLAAAVRTARPRVVVHAAATASIAACARDPILAERINVLATKAAARAAADVGARFVFLSTDQVFDGKNAPYDHHSAAAPLHVYGRTKAAAEAEVRAATANHVVIRLALAFAGSTSGSKSPIDQILDAQRRGSKARLFIDELRSPIWAPKAAEFVAAFALGGAVGTFPVGGPECLSRYDFGLAVCRAFQLLPERVLEAARLDEAPELLPRPRNLAVDSSAAEQATGVVHPSLHDALAAERLRLVKNARSGA